MPHNYPVPEGGYLVNDVKGMENISNNCWLISALHIICGTVIKPLLLREELCSDPTIADLRYTVQMYFQNLMR